MSEGASSRCERCGEGLGPAARFCGHCGASTVDGWTVASAHAHGDDFARSVLDEARESRDAGGLVVALGVYFAALAGNVALLVAKPTTAITLFYYTLALALCGVVAVALRRRELGPLFGAPKLEPLTIAVGLGAGAAAYGLAKLVVSLLGGDEAVLIDLYRRDGHGLGLVLLDVSLLTAIGEELLFRGLVLGACLRTFGERKAIIVSTLLFASLHVSPASFPHLCLLGATFAWLRLRTGSLLPPIALHAAYNAVVVLEAW